MRSPPSSSTLDREDCPEITYDNDHGDAESGSETKLDQDSGNRLQGMLRRELGRSFLSKSAEEVEMAGTLTQRAGISEG